MPTGRSSEVSRTEELIGNAGIATILAGGLALAFSSCSTAVSDKDAVCRQTGPTSFQIVDVRDRSVPLVLHTFIARHDLSQGFANRKLLKGGNDYAEAEINLDKGICAISERGKNPNFFGHYYKLEKQP